MSNESSSTLGIELRGADGAVASASRSELGSSTVGTALWQPPLAGEKPADFDVFVGDLHRAIADIGRDHARAALASSLSVEDMVITHAIAATGAPIDVFMIDTGRLHAETLQLRELVRTRLGIDMLVMQPRSEAVVQFVARRGLNGFYEGVAQRLECCHLRKVEPLERALAGRAAWLTGQRRAHGPERAQLAERELDAAREIPKFNPLATWSDAAVWYYARSEDLPVNPLYARGYPSIGCEPCTRAVRAGEDARAGRWWWEASASKECGLHVFANPATATVDRSVATPVNESAHETTHRQ